VPSRPRSPRPSVRLGRPHHGRHWKQVTSIRVASTPSAEHGAGAQVTSVRLATAPPSSGTLRRPSN